MAELPDQLQRDLAALRVRAGPPAGVERRVLASIEAAGFDLGPDPDPDPDPDPGSAPDLDPDPGLTELGTRAGDAVAQLVWSAKVVAVTLALTGAGLLAVRGTVLLARALAPAPADGSAATDGVAPEPRASTADEPGPTPTATPGPIEPPPTVRTPAPARAIAKPRAVEPLPGDTLAAELALIESARSANDPGTALDRLGRHEQEFPAGALALERDLLMIESLCALERFDQARARDRELGLVHGDSPQRAKLRKVCPELGRE